MEDAKPTMEDAKPTMEDAKPTGRYVYPERLPYASQLVDGVRWLYHLAGVDGVFTMRVQVDPEGRFDPVRPVWVLTTEGRWVHPSSSPFPPLPFGVLCDFCFGEGKLARAWYRREKIVWGSAVSADPKEIGQKVTILDGGAVKGVKDPSNRNDAHAYSYPIVLDGQGGVEKISDSEALADGIRRLYRLAGVDDLASWKGAFRVKLGYGGKPSPATNVEVLLTSLASFRWVSPHPPLPFGVLCDFCFGERKLAWAWARGESPEWSAMVTSDPWGMGRSVKLHEPLSFKGDLKGFVGILKEDLVGAVRVLWRWVKGIGEKIIEALREVRRWYNLRVPSAGAHDLLDPDLGPEAWVDEYRNRYMDALSLRLGVPSKELGPQRWSPFSDALAKSQALAGEMDPQLVARMLSEGVQPGVPAVPASPSKEILAKSKALSSGKEPSPLGGSYSASDAATTSVTAVTTPVVGNEPKSSNRANTPPSSEEEGKKRTSWDPDAGALERISAPKKAVDIVEKHWVEDYWRKKLDDCMKKEQPSAKESSWKGSIPAGADLAKKAILSLNARNSPDHPSWK